MSSADVIFGRALLQECRADAKKAKVKIPHLTTWKSSGFSNPYFTVWGPKGLLWEGNADNAYEAKAKCIEMLIENNKLDEEPDECIER